MHCRKVILFIVITITLLSSSVAATIEPSATITLPEGLRWGMNLIDLRGSIDGELLQLNYGVYYTLRGFEAELLGIKADRILASFDYSALTSLLIELDNDTKRQNAFIMLKEKLGLPGMLDETFYYWITDDCEVRLWSQGVSWYLSIELWDARPHIPEQDDPNEVDNGGFRGLKWHSRDINMSEFTLWGITDYEGYELDVYTRADEWIGLGDIPLLLVGYLFKDNDLKGVMLRANRSLAEKIIEATTERFGPIYEDPSNIETAAWSKTYTYISTRVSDECFDLFLVSNEIICINSRLHGFREAQQWYIEYVAKIEAEKKMLDSKTKW